MNLPTYHLLQADLVFDWYSSLEYQYRFNSDGSIGTTLVLRCLNETSIYFKMYKTFQRLIHAITSNTKHVFHTKHVASMCTYKWKEWCVASWSEGWLYAHTGPFFSLTCLKRSENKGSVWASTNIELCSGSRSVLSFIATIIIMMMMMIEGRPI